jgi:hypothetical protein
MRATLASILADVCCVLVFVVIGRHVHGHGDTAAGIWQTAWPFLTGLGLGLLAGRAWRRPAALVPAGVCAWIGAAGAGMVVRVLAGQGTAAAFIVVTFAFMALFMLGWRAIATGLRQFRHSRIAA